MFARHAAVPGLLSISLALTGCVLPPAVTMAAVAVDFGSLFATGKTATDHAVSHAVKEDCRVWRGIRKASIHAVCLDDDELLIAQTEGAKAAALAAARRERQLLALRLELQARGDEPN